MSTTQTLDEDVTFNVITKPFNEAEIGGILLFEDRLHIKLERSVAWCFSTKSQVTFDYGTPVIVPNKIKIVYEI
jgi:hypothetical protein